MTCLCKFPFLTNSLFTLDMCLLLFRNPHLGRNINVESADDIHAHDESQIIEMSFQIRKYFQIYLGVGWVSGGYPIW